jgi:hypothetical protein
MTIQEALALGNEGIEKLMENGHGQDYLGLIGFAYSQIDETLAMVKETNRQNRILIEANEKLITRIHSLEEVITDWEQEALEEQQGNLLEALNGLLESEGAPKLAILSVIRFLNQTTTN